MAGGTLIYSPGVRVFIDTEEAGTVDVTEDLRDGQLQLAENQISSFSCTLLNHNRKYDGLFAPNDRIHVQMKRIRWLPVFSGYLNSVPYFSVYPRAIPLTASCSLKRLQYTFWDAGTPSSADLLLNAGLNAEGEDGGLRDKVVALLTNVVNWDRQAIHIGGIPGEWRDQLEPLKAALASHVDVDPALLGETGAMNGEAATNFGSKIVDSAGPGTGALPVTRGKVRSVSNINRVLELTTPERGGPGDVGSTNGFRDQWYVQMRWPYKSPSGNVVVTSTEASAAKKWWKNRKILVVNPENNRGVVLRAVDWGPELNSGYALSMSPHALNTVLGAKTGDSLEVRFANSGLPLGELTVTESNRSSGGGVRGVPGSTTSGPTPTMPIPSYTGGVAQPVSAQPTVGSASGLRFTDRRDLEGHVAAAFDFIKNGWSETRTIGGYSNRNIAGTNTPSDHAKGLALDVHVADAIGREPTPDQIPFGNAVAKWFVENPGVFKTNYVIWNDKANYGNGWVQYRPKEWKGGNRHPSPTQGHRDHVHISFDPSQQTQPGPQGTPFPGYDDPHVTGTGNITSPLIPTGTGGLLDPASGWTPISDPFSTYLTGARALLNDTPIFDTIRLLVSSSMRSFMSAPNGDFIAWFPDYFGQYNSAGKMIIRDIELLNDGFNMTWSDERLVTHQFTAGVYHAYNTGAQPGGQVTLENKINTLGIATVEFTELMNALFNVSSSNKRAKYFRDAEAILQRFGARVSYKPMTLIVGAEAEFWYAVRLFQQAWASQFSSQVNLSFMPEVYPGMLLEIEGIGLQVYVTSVSHNFDYGGGGFTTTVTVVAPSATDRSGFYGLPLAGSQRRRQQPSGHRGSGRII